jgi:hypothetical protein
MGTIFSCASVVMHIVCVAYSVWRAALQHIQRGTWVTLVVISYGPVNLPHMKFLYRSDFHIKSGNPIRILVAIWIIHRAARVKCCPHSVIEPALQHIQRGIYADLVVISYGADNRSHLKFIYNSDFRISYENPIRILLAIWIIHRAAESSVVLTV